MRAATKAYVVMIPAYNLTEENSMVAIFQQAGKADAIITYTANPETRPLRAQIVSRGFVALCNILFGLNLPYYNGIALLRTTLVQSVPMSANNHAYMAEILIYMMKSGVNHIEVPQILRQTMRSGSIFNFKSMKDSLKTLLALFWKIHFRRIRLKI